MSISTYGREVGGNAKTHSLDVRQVLHRIVDCYEHTHLKRLQLSLFCPSGQRKNRSISSQPNPPPHPAQSDPIQKAQHVFIRQSFQRSLNLFIQVKHVQDRDLLQPPGVGYKDYVEEAAKLIRQGKLIVGGRVKNARMLKAQRLWFDRGGVSNQTSSFREKLSSGKTRSFAIQLGPLRRSQR